MAADRPVWAPSEVALDQPSVARIWDWFLGGSHNFAIDREVARKTLELMPEGPAMARLSRAFLRRAVAYCAHAGITQFIDLGSGIPTVGNVHEVARQVTPDARVVYVDVDPVAVAHTRQMMAGDERTAAVQADLRDPERVLGAPELRDLLDLEQPVALLMVMVLHFVPDADDPAAVVAGYRAASAPGSYLAVSHATRDYLPEQIRRLEEVYSRSSAPMTFRSHAEVTALMQGYDLVPPGLVDMIRWRPDEENPLPDPLGGDVKRYSGYGAVGRRE
jgi:hypothetical protein